MHGGEPGRGVGRDADERRLAERGGAADPGQQHQAERHQGADADVVEQRDGEVAQQGRRDRQAGDHDARQRELSVAGIHRSTSSTSSSTCAMKKERSISTGISRLNTITSLSAPLQNEAKLSTAPTASAPIAVRG